MLLCVCERGGGVLQRVFFVSLPFQLKRDCCAICFTFQMEFQSGDQLAWKLHCVFFPSVLLTVCQMGNAILHLNLFIRPIQKWYDCKDFRSISFFFPEVYPIVVSISARIANKTKNLVFDVMARNEGRRERHEKSLHIAYCRSFYSQCEWNREFYESKAKH